MHVGWTEYLVDLSTTNSPDCNVFDLGFFAAIQSLQQREASSNIDEMIVAVVKAFGDLTLESLDNVFLSLQAALECTMNNEGSNAFKLPHLGKAALRRQGKLPESSRNKIRTEDFLKFYGNGILILFLTLILRVKKKKYFFFLKKMKAICFEKSTNPSIRHWRHYSILKTVYLIKSKADFIHVKIISE
jgi:hypothetical protein